MEEASDSINAFQPNLSKAKNIWGLLLKTRLKLDVCFSIENFLNLALFIIQAFPAGKDMLLTFKKRVEKNPKLITRACLALSTIIKKHKATIIAYVKRIRLLFLQSTHKYIFICTYRNTLPTPHFPLYPVLCLLEKLIIHWELKDLIKGQQTAAWIKMKKGTGLKEMFEGKPLKQNVGFCASYVCFS